MDRADERRFGGLSPFELKDRLVALAKHRAERTWLNAGRGNPNWLALEPRAAFFTLGAFAVAESARVPIGPAAGPAFGGLPRRRGLHGRLQAFLAERPDEPASALLLRGVEQACARHGFDADRLVGEWVDGILGDHYPLPVRMLEHAQALVRAHLVDELFGGDAAAGAFDLFAVEGASAGMTYVFQSLVHARLLEPGDTIALGVPIFTPYLELPRLPEYRFRTVEIEQDERSGWRYPAEQIDKLRDPRVRLFVAVNPSNPTARAIDPDAVARIAAIARDRPELVIVTDDVYAPFVDRFRSLAAAAPRQTILLYSFSKYWGATGWRLGVVGVHEDSLLDTRLAAAPPRQRHAAARRYASLSPAPQRLKFIDRLAADSRGVGLNHTAGLSTPQQVQMSLFALDAARDAAGERRRAARAIVRERCASLYRGAGLALPDDALSTHYYATLDLPLLARHRHGADFARWLLASVEPIDAVVRLAEERGIVLLDGGGFHAPRMSVRVSLANLPDDAYEPIGRAIVELLDAYHRRWRQGASARP